MKFWKAIFVTMLTFTLCLMPISATHREHNNTQLQEDAEPTSTATDRVLRFLVMGCDRAAGLTDSIFIVTVNETAKQASVLQIPRDTYANYTDRDYKKLNGAKRALGENGVKTLLSEALGVPIDYFVVLDLSALRRVVDAVGGVDVEIPCEMSYTDEAQGLTVRLPKGLRHLTGEEAEQLVRYRSGYANADLGRLDAQKLFLRAFARSCRAMDFAALLRVTGIAVASVKTDLGIGEAIRLISVLRECDPDTTPMATLAGEAVQGNSGAWYYCLRRIDAWRMVNAYLMPDPPIAEDAFDTKRLFDRFDNEAFHKIYTAEIDENRPAEANETQERNNLNGRNDSGKASSPDGSGATGACARHF